MSSIKDFKDRVKALELELSIARATLHSAKMVMAGVSVGDVVIGTGRFDGKKIRITNVDTRWSPPWLSGNVEKADGSFGTGIRNIYEHWVKP